MAAILIRKHAILKRHYRRAVAATPQFHELDGEAQWAAVRRLVEQDATTPEGVNLLKIMDSRTGRRDEVLSALEDARQHSVR